MTIEQTQYKSPPPNTSNQYEQVSAVSNNQAIYANKNLEPEKGNSSTYLSPILGSSQVLTPQYANSTTETTQPNPSNQYANAKI